MHTFGVLAHGGCGSFLLSFERSRSATREEWFAACEGSIAPVGPVTGKAPDDLNHIGYPGPLAMLERATLGRFSIPGLNSARCD
jgi:hypothetical protein